MSRVANNPVIVPEKVEVVVNASEISVTGPLGNLTQALVDVVELVRDGESITVKALDKSKFAKAMSGTTRALLANMIQGVSVGFTKELSLIGVGYKAAAQGDKLNLELGFSHPVNYPLPAGVTAKTPTPTEVILTGSDKQVVGQAAAEIRAYREPEPYKGKGVRYKDEHVVMKETKKK